MILPGFVCQGWDEFDTLRARWKAALNGWELDLADPAVAARVRSIESSGRSVWNSLDKSPNRKALWSDLASTTVSSQITSSYNRLRSMALALETQGSGLFQDQQLAADVISALDWMYANRYNENLRSYDNWWDWEIGTPLAINDIVTLLYDRLDEERRTRYLRAVDRFTPVVKYTGANRVWLATVVGIRGVLVKDAAKLAAARDGLSEVFEFVTSGDGFYRDGSFIQHTRHPYTGGYGASLLANLSAVLWLLQGSRWEVTDPNLANVWFWVYEAFRPLIYRGAMMDMVRGREISRSGGDHATGHSVMVSIFRLSQVAPPEIAWDFRRMVKGWALSDTSRNFLQSVPLFLYQDAKAMLGDETFPPAEELVRHKPYPSMDRVVHLRPGFGLGLSMSSRRIYRYESINQENLKGWYTGDGMLYLYNHDLTHYSDEFWPTVDPYRLPGTTVDTQRRADGSGQSGAPPVDWVGGTVLFDLFGAVGMELAAFQSTLRARKSWFFFDNEVVALGAAIRASDGRPIETIIENRKLSSKAEETLHVNGERMPSTLGWSQRLEDVAWVHLEGVAGYVFPTPAQVHGLRERRTGTWKAINDRSGSATPVSRNYLTLWLDHGPNPSGASYAYILLPNATAEETAVYASAPEVEVLENSDEAQAVREKALGITAVNFWTAATKQSAGITCSTRASVMLAESAEFLDVAVSDPTQVNTGAIRLELDRSATAVAHADEGVTVEQLSPTVRISVAVRNARGRTFSLRLAR
jgi:hyaluronate lyase